MLSFALPSRKWCCGYYCYRPWKGSRRITRNEKGGEEGRHTTWVHVSMILSSPKPEKKGGLTKRRCAYKYAERESTNPEKVLRIVTTTPIFMGSGTFTRNGKGAGKDSFGTKPVGVSHHLALLPAETGTNYGAIYHVEY